MAEALRWLGQGLVYALAAAGVGWFAQNPVWHNFPPDRARLVLALVHGGARVEACRRLSYEEIRSLPPSERRPSTCKRERRPVRVQLRLDGRVLYDEMLPPTGLSGDGPSRVYAKFDVPAGPHCLLARLEDRGREDAFAWEREVTVTLPPRGRLGIDFKADKGGFLFYNLEVRPGCRS